MGQFFHEASMTALHHGFPDPLLWPSQQQQLDDDCGFVTAAAAANRPWWWGEGGGASALAVRALSCYREALRRQAFGALALRAQADAAAAAAGGGGGAEESPASEEEAASPDWAAPTFGTSKVTSAPVPLLGDEVSPPQLSHEQSASTGF
jgi:hypothetical protein